MGVSCLWFHRRRTLTLFLVPTAAVLVLFWCKYYHYWHQGILFLWWLTVLWMSFTQPDTEPAESRTWMRSGVLAALSLTVIVHVYWGVRTSLMDVKDAYSPGIAVARFLGEERFAESQIAGTTFWVTAVQPYFPENVLGNYPSGRDAAYWVWGASWGERTGLNSAMAAEPDVLVIGRPSATPERLGMYGLARVFDGRRLWKAGVAQTDRLAVYVRLSPPTSRDTAPAP